MPIIEIAQSLGIFVFVCLAAAVVLALVVVGLERLEMATIPIDRPPARRRDGSRHSRS